jgi:hypothetical protein
MLPSFVPFSAFNVHIAHCAWETEAVEQLKTRDRSRYLNHFMGTKLLKI